MRILEKAPCVAFLGLMACACCCSMPGPRAPEVPTQQIEVLLEQKLKAQGLVEQALALDGEPAEQKVLYLKALGLDPSLANAYNNLGLVYLEEGNYGEAVRLLREAAKRMPGNPVPRFNLGYTYELVGRLGSAQEQYAAAASMAPDEPDYVESLARVYIRRRDRLGEARDLLKDALRVETRPDHVKWINDQLEMLQKGFIP